MMDGGTKDIDSGKHHEKNKGEGPLVLTWKMTQRRELPRKEVIKIGNVNLTLNSDGSWNFSGQMNETDVFGTDFRFYIVMAVRSSEGTSVLFSHSDVVRKSNPESYSWQKQGNNPTIKDNFKSFKEDLDWAGHWTCVFALAEVGHGGRNDPNLQRSCLFVKNAIPGVNCKGI
jgi:hypothetical protein